FTSLAIVEGLHDTYTIFSGFNSIIDSNTSLSIPFLGGSRTSLFAFISFSIIWGNTFSAFPVINSTFFTLFNSAFLLASLIASSTTSIPYTFFALSDIHSDMVPIPQYKSYTISFLFKSEYSISLSYIAFACILFTWKKELGDILNL